jgi:hypothetical protein
LLLVETQPINNLPSSITHLTLGHHFNNSVELLPPNLKFLMFGHNFNESVNSLPDTITHLFFGYRFNKPVNSLPKNLLHLTFGNCFTKSVKCLPSTITHLIFGNSFNGTVNKLPSTITHLALGSSFNREVNGDLFINLKYLSFYSKTKINNIPTNVDTLKIYFFQESARNCYIENLPITIKKILINDIGKIEYIKKIPFGCEVVEIKHSYNFVHEPFNCEELEKKLNNNLNKFL